MNYGKTAAGQNAFKSRSGMTPRQRAAFILFDGKRSWADVQATTDIAEAEALDLVRRGYIAPAQAAPR